MVTLAEKLLANVGTPLMWASMFHLLIGNALIGIGEGLLLARMFRVARRRAVFCMCGANYFSMGVTTFGLAWAEYDSLSNSLPGVTIENMRVMLIAGTLACIIASAILEWPFCFLSLNTAKARLHSSIVGTVAVQAVSYALLIPLYLLVSPVSLLTSVSVIDAGAIEKQISADVYYIDSSDGNVYRTDLNGAIREPVAQVDIKDPNARLCLHWSSDANTYDLLVRWGHRADETRVAKTGFLPSDAVVGDALEERHTSRDGWMSVGPAVNLQPESDRAWMVRTGFWSGEGIIARNDHLGRSLRLALETPILKWASRSATVLPGGLTVYQLGDQIVLLDPTTRKMALLARGRGPLVVLR